MPLGRTIRIPDPHLVDRSLLGPDTEIYLMQQPSLGKPLTPKDLVELALKFANHPTAENWYRLSPLGQRSPRKTIEGTAEQLQAALSTIARGAQTLKEIEAWKAAAASMRGILEFVIEDGKISTKIAQWVPPLKMLDNLNGIQPDRLSQMFTVDRRAILATALLLLLDPAQKFFGLMHECGLGPSCDLERFFFGNRKYCFPQHRTNTGADYKERQKAAREIKRRHPGRSLAWARARVNEVKQPRLKSLDLVHRVLESQAKQQPSTGRRRSR